MAAAAAIGEGGEREGGQPPSNSRVRRRAWCVTVFAAELTESEKAWSAPMPGVRYLAWQKEQCPDTGRMHLQCYVETSTQCGRKRVQDLLGDAGCHVEPRYGTQQQAIEYCTSEQYDGKDKGRVSGPWELGEKAKEGRPKLSMTEAAEVVRKRGRAALYEDHPVAALHDKAWRIIEQFEAKKARLAAGYSAPRVIILTGPIRIGKTRWVYDRYGVEVYMVPFHDTKGETWFEQYDGERVILFDDFNHYNNIKYTKMLRLLGGYPEQMPVKFGSAFLPSDVTLVFTSNEEWYEWYPMVENKDALFARLCEFGKQMKKFTACGVSVWEECAFGGVTI